MPKPKKKTTRKAKVSPYVKSSPGDAEYSADLKVKYYIDKIVCNYKLLAKEEKERFI